MDVNIMILLQKTKLRLTFKNAEIHGRDHRSQGELDRIAMHKPSGYVKIASEAMAIEIVRFPMNNGNFL